MKLALQSSSVVRYAAVGVANTAFGYSIIYAGMYLGTVAANVVGYAAGFVLSFFLNRRITFRSSARVSTAMPKFAAVTACAYLANLAVVVILERALDLNPYVAQAGGLFPYLAIGYLGSRYLVFGDRSATRCSND